MSILIVCAEHQQKEQEQLTKALGELTELTFTTSFADAELHYDQNKPDLIFTCDVVNKANAFDFCTRIRLIKEDDTTPIIIFSPDRNKENRIRAFQVGGDEYITEFDIDYIKAVIERLLENTQKLRMLSQEKEQASNLVMETLKASSELGNVILFIKRCQRVDTYNQIADEIINFCQPYQLNVVVGILEGTNWSFYSPTGDTTKLEQDLIASVHQQGRFVDFGLRTQMNWSSIALLVKNMPLRDPELYGRIKDLLPTLLSSANIRIHIMYEEKRIKEQTRLMTRSIETLQPSLQTVIDAMHKDMQQHRNELSAFLQQIILTLPKLGLEEDQEDFFVSSVESLISQVDLLADKSKNHQDTLNTTSQVLLNLLEKQIEIQTLIDRLAEPANDNNGSSELF
ncbi:MAG: hypothetical protein P8X89_01235 [Reinekea sp.]